MFANSFPILLLFSTLSVHKTLATEYYDPPMPGDCILPPYPAHGTYKSSVLDANPGDAYDFFSIVIFCDKGYEVENYVVVCSDGEWSAPVPDCVEHSRVKRDGEEMGVSVKPIKSRELPWHTDIYYKLASPYRHICGGSLIRRNVVLSAAGCFRSLFKEAPAARRYAVAVGKLYKRYDDSDMENSQKSDVKEIHIPHMFHGSETNFQYDIAVLITIISFEYNLLVSPISIYSEFDFRLHPSITVGKTGKVPTWNVTKEHGTEALKLKTVEVSDIDMHKCLSLSPPSFREYITTDKGCAKSTNDESTLCEADYGSGMAYPFSQRGSTQYFLKGILSKAPRIDLCDNSYFTLFTQVARHDNFIRSFMV